MPLRRIFCYIRPVRSTFFYILCLLVGFGGLGCSKKQSPLGKIPVPDLGKPADLLPSILRVRYKPGSSGVENCASCHQEYVKEWKGSAHARATVTEIFKTTSGHYDLENCMTCHAPKEIGLDTNRPPARDWKIEEGVTCSACHVVDDTVRGVYDSNAPHHTDHAPGMGTSLACASCHQPSYEQWQKSTWAQEGKSCQSCHMPEVQRWIADYSRIGYSRKTGHKHTFSMDFSDVVDLQIRSGQLSPEQITLSVTNRGAGHDLPTGVFGDAEVIVEFEIQDPERTIFSRKESLRPRDNSSIRSGETRRFFYSFRPPAPRSYLMVARVLFRSSTLKDAVVLAEKQQYLYQE